ncbi:hypothetical protein PR048_012426 [Dryococelus australis]|uniref:Transposase Helix-turn-helix domain-containing protein n=1 Tax=Dryococelus australis TaxID=614101 RepID=A0ABQ9HPD9_9NEOP|nr:hypothetical protein PR048_012426 [Dryococelus australis]
MDLMKWIKFLNNIFSMNNRKRPVSPLNQLLLTFRFYSTGSSLTMCGDLTGVHKSTACRVVHRITHYIALLPNDATEIPASIREHRTIVQNFYEIAGYPGVIGTTVHMRYRNKTL